MQKKLIALAVAGLVAAPVFAQSNVTIYGRMDYGYVNQSGNSGAVQNVQSKSSFASGVQAGSRLGFKGAEDLGNGLKAIFETEYGTGIDQTAAPSTAATWTNRHSYVGLTGGFGTVVGGRLDGVRYGIFNKYDAFNGGTVGNFTQMTGQVDRADNAIAYISPNFSGFTVTAAYATNVAGPEAAGNRNDGQLNTLMGNYENGPLSLTLDYETIKSHKEAAFAAVAAVPGNAGTAAITGNSTDAKVVTLAGSYDFGVVKLAALWDSHKNDSKNFVTGVSARALDYRDWFISAKAPITGTKLALKATYGSIDDKTAANADAKKFGIGLDYSLSKRTMVYTDYGRIRNNSNGAYQINYAPNAMGNNGVNGFDVGLAHNF